MKRYWPGVRVTRLYWVCTLVETTHPKDDIKQREQYSSKGKMFAISIAALIDKNGSWCVKPTLGKISRYNGFRENISDYGKWMHKMQDNKTPEERIQVIGDSSYQGLNRYYTDIDEIIPYKKPKNKKLSKRYTTRPTPREG